MMISKYEVLEHQISFFIDLYIFFSHFLVLCFFGSLYLFLLFSFRYLSGKDRFFDLELKTFRLGKFWYLKVFFLFGCIFSSLYVLFFGLPEFVLILVTIVVSNVAEGMLRGFEGNPLKDEKDRIGVIANAHYDRWSYSLDNSIYNNSHLKKERIEFLSQKERQIEQAILEGKITSITIAKSYPYRRDFDSGIIPTDQNEFIEVDGACAQEIMANHPLVLPVGTPIDVKVINSDPNRRHAWRVPEAGISKRLWPFEYTRKFIAFEKEGQYRGRGKRYYDRHMEVRIEILSKEKYREYQEAEFSESFIGGIEWGARYGFQPGERVEFEVAEFGDDTYVEKQILMKNKQKYLLYERPKALTCKDLGYESYVKVRLPKGKGFTSGRKF